MTRGKQRQWAAVAVGMVGLTLANDGRCLQRVSSSVPPQSFLDLDQVAIQDTVEANQSLAMQIYKQGLFAGSLAFVTVNPLTWPLEPGQVVQGQTTDTRAGNYIVVNLTNVNYASLGETELKLLYRNATCPGEGCLADSGTLLVLRDNRRIAYSEVENRHLYSLQSLSTNADVTMRPCPLCPYYRDFRLAFEYYQQADFGDVFVQAAADQRPTRLANGNVNFATTFQSLSQESIPLLTKTVNVFYQVIGELEAALTSCTCVNCGVSTGASPLDLAFGYYYGSLVLLDQNTNGVFSYGLANTYCSLFATCNVNGTANVNSVITQQFADLHVALEDGDCSRAQTLVDQTVANLFIPLIQGILYATYFPSFNVINRALHVGRGVSLGALYAVSFLPRLNNCSAVDAELLHTSLQQVGVFPIVKDLLERNYRCLSVTCSQIGGIWNNKTDQYQPGADPCGDQLLMSAQEKQSSATMLLVRGSFALLLYLGLDLLLL